jgi:hypothetical protein
MGGVNNATDYINLMGFGYVNEEGDPVVTDSLLQGGIVSRGFKAESSSSTSDNYRRCLSITLVPSWAASSAAGLATKSVASVQSLSEPRGQSLAPHCNAQLKTTSG